MHKTAVPPLMLGVVLVAFAGSASSQPVPAVASTVAAGPTSGAGVDPASGDAPEEASCFDGSSGELVLRASRRCSGARLQAQLREALGLPAEPGARAAEAVGAATPVRAPMPTPPARSADAPMPAPGAGRGGAWPSLPDPRPPRQPSAAATTPPGAVRPMAGVPATPVSTQASTARSPQAKAASPEPSAAIVRARPTGQMPAYRVPVVPSVPTLASVPARPPSTPTPSAAPAQPNPAVAATGSDPARGARTGGEHPLSRLQQLRSIESGWRSSTVGRTP